MPALSEWNALRRDVEHARDFATHGSVALLAKCLLRLIDLVQRTITQR